MAKTVGGVVRLGGPLSPDTLPSNAFIITVEEKKFSVTLKTNYKHFLYFASVQLYVCDTSAAIVPTLVAPHDTSDLGHNLTWMSA